MSGMDRLTDERHADTERNRILNIALTNLDAIINGHNPDVDTSINNMVWDRLDKLACDVELLAHRRASQAAPAPVAWLWERGGDQELTLRNDGVHGPRLALNGFTAHPLYRAPAPSDGLREAVDAAWNDAIEAAGNLESIHGYSNAVPRHRIRALRRAAPMGGEA